VASLSPLGSVIFDIFLVSVGAKNAHSGVFVRPFPLVWGPFLLLALWRTWLLLSCPVLRTSSLKILVRVPDVVRFPGFFPLMKPPALHQAAWCVSPTRCNSLSPFRLPSIWFLGFFMGAAGGTRSQAANFDIMESLSRDRFSF